jgi:hypothetical protein
MDEKNNGQQPEFEKYIQDLNKSCLEANHWNNEAFDIS